MKRGLLSIAMLLALPSFASAAFNCWSVTRGVMPAERAATLVAPADDAVLGIKTVGNITYVQAANGQLCASAPAELTFTLTPPAGQAPVVKVDGLTKAVPTVGVANTYTVTKGTKITHTINATYAATATLVSINTIGATGGYIEPSKKIAYNGDTTVTITPAAGFTVTGVKINGLLDAAALAEIGADGGAVSLNDVTATTTVSAVFTQTPTLVASIATANATLTVDQLLNLKGSAAVNVSTITPAYAWSVSPATGATLGNANSANATFTATAAGTYTVTLTVTGGGLTDTEARTIIVQSAQATVSNTCTSCHSTRDAAISTGYAASKHATTANGNVSCVSCHNPAGTANHPFELAAAAAACATCHSNPAYKPATHGLATVGKCGSCHDSHTLQPKVLAGNYVGSEMCSTCHSAEYETFVKSGHNFKINKIENAQAPAYPFSSIAGALENMPATQAQMLNTYYQKPASYSDVSYVVGGYKWKARWMDKGGYLVSSSTGGVQYNLAYPSSNQTLGQGWSTYGSANKKYTCGECHTTGWKYYGGTDVAFKQDNLPGIPGTWVQSGIQCEACHGAGKAHAVAPTAENIVKAASGRTQAQLQAETGFGYAVACGECHTRDGERNPYGGEGAATDGTMRSAYNVASGTTDQIGGRIRAGSLNSPIGGHHQTGDEIFGVDPDNLAAGPQGKHYLAGVTCGSCHNPHATTAYQNQSGNGPGVDVACTECHEVTFTGTGATHAKPENCLKCHMPYLAKSAVNLPNNAAGKAQGDIRTHVMKINIDAASHVAAADGGKFLKPYISRDFACGVCHGPDSAAVLAKVDALKAGFGGKVHGVIRFKHTNTAGVKPVGASCNSCHTTGTPEVATKSGEYVGSATCGTCHTDKYATFIQSGHPYKLNKVVNGQAPVYPFASQNEQLAGKLQQVADADDDGAIAKANGTMTDNADGFPRADYSTASYSDVSYVIGGFGWKTRWIDNAGYVITGSKAQYNIVKDTWTGGITSQWSPYNNNTVTKYDYNCNYCHVTGARNGTAPGETGATFPTDLNPTMPGFGGDDFAYPGIQCEACHGAGLNHVKNGGTKADITKVATPRPIAALVADSGYGDAMSCGECHTRDNERLAKYAYKSYFEKYRYPAEIAKFNSDFGGTAMTGLIISNSHGRTSHHEVNEELQGIDPTNVMAGPQGAHKHLKCNDCHKPHQTMAYAANKADAMTQACTACHPNKTFGAGVATMMGAAGAPGCVDCHMPYLIQNATSIAKNGWTFGDNRSHTMKLELAKSATVAGNQNIQVTDVDAAKRWYAFPTITREYACLWCHGAKKTDGITDRVTDWSTFKVHQ